MPDPQKPGTVRGYTAQSQEMIDLVNRAKAIEDELGELWHEAAGMEGVDQSMLEWARMRWQEGSMWFARAAFQPRSRLGG